MKNAIHSHKKDHGLEIAISPYDLWIKANCRILEKQSTSGFEEVPQIEYPDIHALTNRMIQYDQHWCVEFTWNVYGPLACLLDCGYWKCEVLFELMGGGETSFNQDVTVLDIGKPGHHYTSLIDIKPESLKPGVYRVIFCMQYYFKNNKPGPIAGFEDKGLIKVYQDKKAYGPINAPNGVAEIVTT